MPNWVRNKITIHAKNYKKIIEEITGDEDNLDFNKVVPRSKDLDVVSGTISNKCVKIYLDSISECPRETLNKYLEAYKTQYKEEFKEFMNADEHNKLMEELLNDKDFITKEPTFKTKADVYAYGKRNLDNVIEYGHANWYDWNIANWGTKWNADNTMINGKEIDFETAWDPPLAFVEALSKKYPEATFHLDFADEQICVYCGECDMENGNLKNEIVFDQCSKEAYEKGFLLWPEVKEHFIFNKKTNNYEYNDGSSDEEMD